MCVCVYVGVEAIVEVCALFNKKDLCVLHLPTCNLPHVAVAVAVAIAVTVTVAVAVAADAANCLPQQSKATFVDVMKWTQLPMQEILCICRLSTVGWGVGKTS